MDQTPPTRRAPRASRLGLAVATFAAVGTFAGVLALVVLPATPVPAASVAGPTTSQLLTNPTTGERVVLDTVYVVTPAPAAAPAVAPAVAPVAPRAGDDGHEGDREGGHETEGSDD